MTPMGYDMVSALVGCHTYEEDVDLRVNSTMVTQLVTL